MRRIGTEHAIEFGGIAAGSFDPSETAAPMLASLVDRPGWHLYMTFFGDAPAGTGAMLIHDGAAWLDLGATLPAF